MAFGHIALRLLIVIDVIWFSSSRISLPRPTCRDYSSSSAPVEATRPVLLQWCVVRVLGVLEQRPQELRCLDQFISVHAVREDVFEEVVDVTHYHAHDVHYHRVAQDHREPEQHIRQVRRLKLKDAEEVHADKRIPAGPHVHQHYRKGLAQEQEVHECPEELRRGRYQVN